MSPSTYIYNLYVCQHTPAVHALLCLAMLFLETSRPHFSQALVSLVDGAIPPHAVSWFSRAPSYPKSMLHLEQAKERRSFAGSCILRTCMAKPPLDLHSLPHPSHLHLRGSSSTHTGFLSAGLST